MNRTRALIIIGVFMLVLAVLAALELRKEDAVIAEGQMVTGSINTTQVPPEVLRRASADAETIVPSHSAPAPVDSALPRSGQDSVLSASSAAVGQAPKPSVALPLPEREVVAPPAPLRTAPTGESTPVANSVSSGEQTGEQLAVRQKGTPEQKESTEPKEEKETPQASPLVVTTKAPAKLTGKQKAITRTRLELGKTISFRLTGAAPLSAKTLLLTSPHRYVVDLQGEWGIALPKVPNNLLLKEIRSGQRENATRLVLELKRKPESTQVVKIDAQTLEVRIR